MCSERLPTEGGLGRWKTAAIAITMVVACSGCATWYQRNLAFQQAVTSGDMEQADKLLKRDKKEAEGKNRVLYYLNKGYVDFCLGERESSNSAFETAERIIDQQGVNLGTEAAVLLTNPEARPYRPEDFEVIMINFYKALNYLALQDMEGALVEVRKINIKLTALNNRYPDHKNRYQRDAFAHLLMGLIYDAAGDNNNAFIAYRNALETYQSDYARNYGIQPPEQLKKDLLRTAHACGFREELQQYEQLFQRQYRPGADTTLIVFWLNGMGPVKAEWSVNFVKQERGNGTIVFHNAELGLTFPFFLGPGYSAEEKNSIAHIHTLRVAFPQYVERRPFYVSARVNGEALEMAEDINAIAFKTLQDRFLRECANSLLRLAAKQGLEQAARKQNEWLGFAVSIVNSLTEKADTRNWQTLPYSISYARVPLREGNRTLSCQLQNSNGSMQEKRFILPQGGRRTLFQVIQTPASRP